MALPLLTETRRALAQLGDAVQVVRRAAGQPRLAGSAGRQWYQFPEKNPLQVIAVKAARAVSGLNASIHLLHEGHFTEVAVILRTVDDFLDEIVFLLEAHQSGNPNAAQKALVEDFFAEDILLPEELLQDRKRPDRTKRKDVRAAQARFLEPTNTDAARRRVMAIDTTWDGYVHGAYPHSMELFDPRTREWALGGAVDAPHTFSMQRHHAFYVSRALSIIGLVCHALGELGSFESVRTAVARFEDSDEFPPP